MDRFQYLFVLVAVVLGTLPLELASTGVRVWRDPARLVFALAPVVAAFTVWDLAAVAHGTWGFSPTYTIGLELPGDLPIEELLFFVVIPVAAILTREVLRARSTRDQHERRTTRIRSEVTR